MNSINPSQEQSRLWKDLTEEFRRACLLRRQGDSEEADKIVNDDLPMLISRWSQASGSANTTKREQLNTMFARERERIDDAWLLQQMLLRQMRDILIPSLCLQVAEEVREVMEVQVGEITRKLAALKREASMARPAAPAAHEHPAPTMRETQPATAIGQDGSHRIVSMPTRGASNATTKPRPNFDDLPAIIDEIISGSQGYDFSRQRAVALV